MYSLHTYCIRSIHRASGWMQWVHNGCIAFSNGWQDFFYVLHPLCIRNGSGIRPLCPCNVAAEVRNERVRLRLTYRKLFRSLRTFQTKIHSRVQSLIYCKSGYFRAINFSRSANSDEFRGFLISRRVGDHFVKLLVQRPSHRCHTRYTVHNCMWLCAQLTCTRLQKYSRIFIFAPFSCCAKCAKIFTPRNIPRLQ